MDSVASGLVKVLLPRVVGNIKIQRMSIAEIIMKIQE